MISPALCYLFSIFAVVRSKDAALQHGGRRLQQAVRSINPSEPISATTADLVNDPTGLGHLLARLGNAEAFQEDFGYLSYPADHYNVPYTVDPTAEDGLTGAATNGSYKVIGNSGAVPIHALPFTNELVLFMTRGANYNGTQYSGFLNVDNGTQAEIAAIYNSTSNTFRPFHMKEHPFCSGQTLLPNGQGIIVGGDNLNLNGNFLTNGIQHIRTFDPKAQEYSIVNIMDRGRWYPTATVMADGNILIVGGMQQEGGGWGTDESPSTSKHPTVRCSANKGGSGADPKLDNPTFQIMNSSDFSLSPQLTLTILLQSWPINSYPFLAVLPQGSTLIIAGSLMDVLFFTPDGAYRDDSTGLLPTLPVPVNYPQSAAFTILTLEAPDYRTIAMIAGGSGEYCSSATTPAGNKSWIFDVSPGANHSLIEEELNFPRVMGELTLLPDGRLFLANGAQIGIAGGAGPASSQGTEGTTVAEIYDPTKPIGQRWSAVGDSKIWRLYHSEAFLTRNAEIFISGSESTAEHRVQIYTPDYLHTNKPRPVIDHVSSLTVGYSVNFTISFSNVSSLDRVVLHRLVGSTHGSHADQRQVLLVCSTADGTATCATPPNNFIAPPGVYMLFVMYEGVPSVAEYMTLQLSQGFMTYMPSIATAG